MTQPHVTITELDGALGILPESAGRIFAIVGVASSGPTNTPAAFARIKDVQTTFGAGPLVEAAAYYIERYGRPVLLTRTANSTAAAVGSVTDVSPVGTSTVTVHSGAAPVDDYELYMVVVAGGTVGAAGLTCQLSLDGGRTLSPVTAIATGSAPIVVPFPDSAGASFELAAGTLVAGENYSAVASAPAWNGTDLGAALDALAAVQTAWELVLIVGTLDSTTFDVVEGKLAGMQASGKRHAYIASPRIPTIAEAAATYVTAMTAMSAAKTTKLGSIYAGGAKTTSSISGRKYRRPSAWAVAALEASVKPHINVADTNLGSLPGVSIRDVNGNPDEFDESLTPGLDDLRYGVLRTHNQLSGVYVNRPRLFSPQGSDFRLMPHRRVFNVGLDALDLYFLKRLNKPVIVSSKTGFLLESEAREIELGAEATLRTALLAEPMASDISFKLSRTDNVLSGLTLSGEMRVLPLAYPEYISLLAGWTNPALRVQQAA